jgi:predicted RNA binding protein YcfA (HicA-like mRNA interferase family)
MSYAPNVWNQIKNLSADDLIRALKRDGWSKDPASRDATIAYLKETSISSTTRRRIVIHYHPKKTYGPGLLKALIDDIGWNENDLRRLGLIR